MDLSSKIAAALFSGMAFVGFAGCASHRASDVPESAAVKAEGNDRLVYVADDAGTLYVTDGDKDIFWSGRVASGDRLMLDPKGDKLTLNDKVISSRNIDHSNHKIYFQPGFTAPVAHAPDASVARPAAVPPTAVLMGEGKDHIEYTADAAGMMWVTDADKESVVYTSRIMPGDRVSISPKDNKILVNGQMASDKSLANNTYRIFVDKGTYMPTAASASVPPMVVSTPAAPVIVRQPGAGPDVITLPPPPTNATLWRAGADRASLTATTDGTVWVVDNTTHRTIYSSRMVKGDTLTIDPSTALLTLNNRPAANVWASAGQYQVFFQPAR